MREKEWETKLCCDPNDLTYFINFVSDFIINSTEEEREKLGITDETYNLFKETDENDN